MPLSRQDQEVDAIRKRLFIIFLFLSFQLYQYIFLENNFIFPPQIHFIANYKSSKLTLLALCHSESLAFVILISPQYVGLAATRQTNDENIIKIDWLLQVVIELYPVIPDWWREVGQLQTPRICRYRCSCDTWPSRREAPPSWPLSALEHLLTSIKDLKKSFFTF